MNGTVWSHTRPNFEILNMAMKEKITFGMIVPSNCLYLYWFCFSHFMYIRKKINSSNCCLCCLRRNVYYGFKEIVFFVFMELNERMKKCPWWYKKSEHNKVFRIVEYVIRNNKSTLILSNSFLGHYERNISCIKWT